MRVVLILILISIRGDLLDLDGRIYGKTCPRAVCSLRAVKSGEFGSTKTSSPYSIWKRENWRTRQTDFIPPTKANSIFHLLLKFKLTNHASSFSPPLSPRALYHARGSPNPHYGFLHSIYECAPFRRRILGV